MKKKFLSLLSVISVILNLSALISYADETPVTEFTIEKDIVLFNADGSQIYEPNIDYTYTVSPVTVENASVTVTDENSATQIIGVRSGIADAVSIKGNAQNAEWNSTAVLTFGADSLTDTNQENQTITINSAHADENLNIRLDASAIYQNGANPAGIYRYQITDTTADTALTSAGIRRNPDYETTLYLDVYTKYNTERDNLLVYGYVLFKDDADHAVSHSFENTTESEADKISGYDVESEEIIDPSDPENPVIISDQYHTHNIEIKKKTAGDLADGSHPFPFTLALKNNIIQSQTDFYDSTGTQKMLSADGIYTESTALRNGESIIFYGLPEHTEIKVTEINDTADQYFVSASMNDEAIELASDLTGNQKSASTEYQSISKTESRDIILFTNTLNDISVTGVFFTVMPFVFITIAGMLLLIVCIRNKKSVG